MDFGINLAPAADSWKVVKRAEELGFSHAWFYDTQLLNADLFVVMAAAASAMRSTMAAAAIVNATLSRAIRVINTRGSNRYPFIGADPARSGNRPCSQTAVSGRIRDDW